jgi:hypothetical protein
MQGSNTQVGPPQISAHARRGASCGAGVLLADRLDPVLELPRDVGLMALKIPFEWLIYNNGLAGRTSVGLRDRPDPQGGNSVHEFGPHGRGRVGAADRLDDRDAVTALEFGTERSRRRSASDRAAHADDGSPIEPLPRAA